MIENFLALDFETACPGKYPPPCSLGVTIVENAAIVSSTNFYICPEVPIDPCCQKIHGISDEIVEGCPNFAGVWETLCRLIEKYHVVAIHNAAFDLMVLEGALNKIGIPIPDFTVYDTMLLSRSHVDSKKSSLPAMCNYFGIPVMGHHNSSSDSEMCARLFLALQYSFGDLGSFALTSKSFVASPARSVSECDDFDDDDEDYISFSFQPEYTSPKPDYVMVDILYDDPIGFSFENKSFVLTGKIGDYERPQLAKMIESHGGIVKTAISRKTDYLIVGLEDLHTVSDRKTGKSTKIKEAERFRDLGAPIQILPGDFLLSFLEEK